MLMNIECSIVQSLKVSLTFDNNKTKDREIAVGDLCYFEFNKNGKRKTIEGKVTKIGLSNTVDSKSWYIVVDGSLDYSGQMERFCPNNILDCDIIQKHDTVQYISTPNDASRITDIRFFNGYIQVSNDGGYSWMTPKNLSDQYSEEDLSDEIVYPAPKPKKKKKKPVYIEEDEEEEDDTTDSDTTDEDDIYYEDDTDEDEDGIEDEVY